MGIYIWGTGCGASEAIENGLNPLWAEAFIETAPSRKSFMGRPVISPRELKNTEAELIIVSTRRAEEIISLCRENNIPEDRLLFLKNSTVTADRNKNCMAAEKILGRELLGKLIQKEINVAVPQCLRDSELIEGGDFVRLGCLELITRRITDLQGAMAELGVYRGDFAAAMNKLLPDKKLYLFDTFEGFEKNEAQGERDRNNCGDAFIEAHRNTSEELVINKMTAAENVIIKRGIFPESLRGLEESFCLVSLDADFRETTLSGLRYFWPRIVPGGYLMLHDWGSQKLRGVAEALELYEQELGQRLPGVPLPDLGNSLVLQKN